MTPETRFRSPNRQETKKWCQDKGKNENSFNSLPGRYLHFNIIRKKVLRQGHKGVKNADLKICSFLTQNRGKKSIFGR